MPSCIIETFPAGKGICQDIYPEAPIPRLQFLYNKVPFLSHIKWWSVIDPSMLISEILISHQLATWILVGLVKYLENVKGVPETRRLQIQWYPRRISYNTNFCISTGISLSHFALLWTLFCKPGLCFPFKGSSMDFRSFLDLMTTQLDCHLLLYWVPPRTSQDYPSHFKGRLNQWPLK